MPADFFETLVNCLKNRRHKNARVVLSAEVFQTWMAPAAAAPLKAPPTPPTAMAADACDPVAPLAAAPPAAAASSAVTLGDAVLRCQRCALSESCTSPLPGEGSLTAKLMIVGEWPGVEDDQNRKHLSGLDGELLSKMIKAMQIAPDEVYVTNIMKCRPVKVGGGNEQNIRLCMDFLTKEIELIRPEVIVLLGATALKMLLGKKDNLAALRGAWQSFAGIPVMPTFHPSYLNRNPAAKREAWSDLKLVMKVLGKQEAAN